jgi:hypothetical protein
LGISFIISAIGLLKAVVWSAVQTRSLTHDVTKGWLYEMEESWENGPRKFMDDKLAGQLKWWGNISKLVRENEKDIHGEWKTGCPGNCNELRKDSEIYRVWHGSARFAGFNDDFIRGLRSLCAKLCLCSFHRLVLR